MGKVLLEKILRNVDPVGKLFILIRKKRNATLQQRLMKEIFGSPVFEPLFNERPEVL